MVVLVASLYQIIQDLVATNVDNEGADELF